MRTPGTKRPASRASEALRDKSIDRAHGWLCLALDPGEKRSPVDLAVLEVEADRRSADGYRLR